MKQILLLIFSWFLRITVRPISALTGRGAGKFATLLPKGQKYLVTKYCGIYKFNVDTTYPMEASVWLSGVYDVVTTTFLGKVLHQGDVFLDIGANCGALTLVAASLIGDGKIYAFEPGHTICSRLQANIDLNPQLKDIVQIIPFGLGAAKGQLFYHEDRSYRGNGALHASYDGIPVEVISLDEWVFLENIDRIDAIKIDVEGMEYEVIMGAKTVLEKFKPLIYFETLKIFFHHTSYDIKTIYTFFYSLGYRIISPTPPHLEIPLNGPYPANSVAIHPSKAKRLGLR